MANTQDDSGHLPNDSILSTLSDLRLRLFRLDSDSDSDSDDNPTLTATLLFDLPRPASTMTAREFLRRSDAGRLLGVPAAEAQTDVNAASADECGTKVFSLGERATVVQSWRERVAAAGSAAPRAGRGRGGGDGGGGAAGEQK